MKNVFLRGKDHATFSWANLGDIKVGRCNLGEEMPVLVYRLMQFTLVDVLSRDFGKEKANDYMRAAGRLAGAEFSRNMLDLKADFDTFIVNLQKTLWDLKVGMLGIEKITENAKEIVMTIAEDLDCSGLSNTNETVCDYDEGFIGGILETYTGKPYSVKEIDCWASGAKICRFQCIVTK
jgi:predicted hydrocarbon binding protein